MVSNGMIVFHEHKECPKCGNEMCKIVSMNIDNETLVYYCEECDSSFVLSYKEAESKSSRSDYFCLNGLGDITYKCGCCRTYVEDRITENAQDNEMVLTAAYDWKCESCYRYYELGESTCFSCGEVIEDAFWSHPYEYEEYCCKDCFLEYHDESELDELVDEDENED